MNDNISDAVIIEDSIGTENIPVEVIEEEIGIPLNDPEVEKELTDEEKEALKIQYLKESRIRFKPIKTNGKVTTNQFSNDYRKNRQRKNKIRKVSNRINRRK